MSWIDTCWGNLNGYWTQKLHPDDVAFLKELTYDVGRRLEARLNGAYTIDPARAPIFHEDLTDGTPRTRYVETYKLVPTTRAEHPAEVLAQNIAALIASKPGSVFSPYWLLTPGDCDGVRIKRDRFMTRLAVWGSNPPTAIRKD
jgi:hypothetical protein